MANTLAWVTALLATQQSTLGETLVTPVNQVAHGFSKGQAVLFDGATWILAKADSDTTIATHVVGEVADVDNFHAVKIGRIDGLSGLTPGATYFVSPTNQGEITVTEPSQVGEISNPVGVALTATVLEVFNYRAFEVN